MTDAYIAGFSKTAEDMGVNPDYLIKVAAGGLFGLLGRGLQALAKPGFAGHVASTLGQVAQKGRGYVGRFGELLAGGNPDVVKDFRTLQKLYNAGYGRLIKNRLTASPEWIKETKSALNEMRKQMAAVRNGTGNIKYMTNAGKTLAVDGSEALTRELNKVLAARIGTGAALTGAGIAGARRLSGAADKTKEPVNKINARNPYTEYDPYTAYDQYYRG